MSAWELLQWWNLVYLLPLALSVVWLLGMMLGGGHHNHGVADHVHAGLLHHLHLGHVHHGAPHEGHPQWMARALGVLGLGRVPLTILMGTAFLCWGAVGMLMNRVFGVSGRMAPVTVWPSLVATGIVTVTFTRAAAGVIARAMPATESYAVAESQLIGCIGEAVYQVSDSSGTVQVADAYGTVHRVMARTAPGEEPIPPGTRVLIVAPGESEGYYLVERSAL